MGRRNDFLAKKSFGIDQISILWFWAGPRTLELLLEGGCCKRRAKEARVGGIDLC